MLMCPFGTVPGSLTVTSQNRNLIEGKPIATIGDMMFPSNISGFGLCTSLANPQVASATAAALGVLTPQPCAMVPMGTWMPMSTKVIVGNKPCISGDARIICAYGASVTIVMPGQSKVIV